MRLLHCIRSLDPAGGGPIEALRQRLAALAARGIESEVACLDAPGAPWLKDFPAAVQSLGPVSLGTYGYSARWTPWVRANHRRFDAVIINGLWQYHGWGTMRALPTGFPYFVYPHGMLDPWFKRTYPLKHLKKWLYWPWAEYRVLRDARAVLFTSEQERLLARQSFWLYRCRERVVNYGTAGPTDDATELRDKFFGKFPGLRDRRFILFLGRVHEKKGVDLLLRAFAELLKSQPALVGPLEVVIAGPADSAYGSRMRQLARESGISSRVTWTGMLQGAEKWGAYHAAEVFCLPSHQENFGVSVAESLACGVPALISDQVNIWREVEQDGAGIVAADDVEGTKAALNQWISLPEGAKSSMRTAARACFDRRFQVKQAAESLLRVIQDGLVETLGP